MHGPHNVGRKVVFQPSPNYDIIVLEVTYWCSPKEDPESDGFYLAVMECGEETFIRHTDFYADENGHRCARWKRDNKKMTNLEYLMERDKGMCQICHRYVMTGDPDPPWRKATTDHIIPKHLGGVNARWNLQLACEQCNNDKGHKMPKGKKELFARCKEWREYCRRKEEMKAKRIKQNGRSKP